MSKQENLQLKLFSQFVQPVTSREVAGDKKKTISGRSQVDQVSIDVKEMAGSERHFEDGRREDGRMLLVDTIRVVSESDLTDAMAWDLEIIIQFINEEK